ncbi:MAG: lysostaphin resistance A-like protein [Planctomycetota bacterium]|jgi:membrane protease YdiL (CAAX protease family)
MNIDNIIQQIISSEFIVEAVICLVGLILLGIWLIKTGFGRKALADSRLRQNNIPIYLPFVPLFVWWGASVTAISIKTRILPDLSEHQNTLMDNSLMSIFGLITILIIISFARQHFYEGLKGFGLKIKTIPKDFGFAVINLTAVLPIVLITLRLTIFFGKILFGQHFELTPHQQLEIAKNYPQMDIRIVIIILAVFIAPVLEEMLFRGLFQTIIRTYLFRPWLSIMLSSCIFVTVHANPQHWPGLLMLSLCLGYSYEKSGSLLRPIFIHSIFNATCITINFLQ